MRFDLVDLRLVLNVAEAASITHGAARSGMALASASERIRAMELALGAPLFERKRRGVSPTAAGATVVHHARLVTQQLELMAGELGQHAKGLRGRVRVFSNTAATQEFLPPLLGAFLASHPHVDVALEERPSAEIVRGIAGGRADIGIVADAVDPATELETFPFAADRLVLVTPAGHPLARRRRLAFQRCPAARLHRPACRQRAAGASRRPCRPRRPPAEAQGAPGGLRRHLPRRRKRHWRCRGVADRGLALPALIGDPHRAAQRRLDACGTCGSA